MLQLLRIAQAGGRNFMRNAWLSTAATAVMTVTLTIVLISFMSNTALTSTIKGLTDKITLSVYLKDGLSQQQHDLVKQRLLDTGNVQEVKFISKDEALARYKEKNKNNPLQLQAIEITGNTLPPSYEVRLRTATTLMMSSKSPASSLSVSYSTTKRPPACPDPAKTLSITSFVAPTSSFSSACLPAPSSWSFRH